MSDIKRDAVLDITKGIGIIFMVLGHLHFSDDVFNLYIYAFHMPLFFIVSGMLFNQERPVASIIRSRAKALLIPYLVFGGIYGVVYIANCILTHDSEAVKSGLKIMLLYPTDRFPYESALWFLPVMFITSVAYAAIRKAMNLKLASIVCLAIGIFGFAYPVLTEVRLPWGIDTAFVALLFFHTGYLMKHYKLVERIKDIKQKQTAIFLLSLIVIAGINVFLIFNNGKLSLRTIKYGNPLLTYVNAVTATTVWICVAVLINESTHLNKTARLLCNISEVSIVFLCVNHNVIRLFQLIVGKAFEVLSLSAGVFDVVLVAVLTLAALLLIGNLINKTKLRVILGRNIQAGQA